MCAEQSADGGGAMRFLILGAGAIGGYFGAKLVNGGGDATFLVRPGRAAQLRSDGLIVKARDGEIRTRVRTLQAGQVDGCYDVVLLACKAYDLDSAIDAVAPAVGPDTVVLPLLNGVRHIDILADRFEASRVIGGLTVINPVMLPNGTIEQSPVSMTITAIGELAGGPSIRCTKIQQALATGGIAVDVAEDIRAAMWQKLFGFACNAAITTLTRSRAGNVAQTAAGSKFVNEVLAEVTFILEAEGYRPAEQTLALIRGLFSQTGSNYAPSLFVDMAEGRPTEGEHTIGDLVRRAEERGIPAPILNAALCNLQAYEISRLAGR